MTQHNELGNDTHPLDARLARLITNFIQTHCKNMSRITKINIIESACEAAKNDLPKKNKAELMKEIAEELNAATLAHLGYELERVCENENQPFDVQAYKEILQNTINMLSKGLEKK